MSEASAHRHSLCKLGDLGDPDSRSFAIGEGPWPLRGFIVRHGERLAAYLNRCPHAGHPLNLRPNQFLTADGEMILCNSHGALFQITDGTCVAGPCVGQALQPLPIRIEAGEVLLDGDLDELIRRHA